MIRWTAAWLMDDVSSVLFRIVLHEVCRWRGFLEVVGDNGIGWQTITNVKCVPKTVGYAREFISPFFFLTSPCSPILM